MGAHSDGSSEERSAAVATAERWLIGGVAVGVGILVLIEVVGGRSWAWTGFQDNQTLWDWLHLLLLPVVLSLLPVISRRHDREPLRGRSLLGLALIALGVTALVVAAYVADWTWTGFDGKTLWDWLELLLLPVSVSLLPFVLQRGDTMRVRWVSGFSLFLATFLLLAVPGYVVPWRWTGVTGNTLWDWIELLIVPFALPVTVALVLNHTRSDD